MYTSAQVSEKLNELSHPFPFQKLMFYSTVAACFDIYQLQIIPHPSIKQNKTLLPFSVNIWNIKKQEGI